MGLPAEAAAEIDKAIDALTLPPTDVGGAGSGGRKPPLTARDFGPSPEDDSYRISLYSPSAGRDVEVQIQLAREVLAPEDGPPHATFTVVVFQGIPEEEFLSVTEEGFLDGSRDQKAFTRRLVRAEDPLGDAIESVLKSGSYQDSDGVILVRETDPEDRYSVFNAIERELEHLEALHLNSKRENKLKLTTHTRSPDSSPSVPTEIGEPPLSLFDPTEMTRVGLYEVLIGDSSEGPVIMEQSQSPARWEQAREVFDNHFRSSLPNPEMVSSSELPFLERMASGHAELLFGKFKTRMEALQSPSVLRPDGSDQAKLEPSKLKAEFVKRAEAFLLRAFKQYKAQHPIDDQEIGLTED